jgi:hypothetical protein
MFKISEAVIDGNASDIAEMKRIFGKIEFRGSGETPLLCLTRVLPNFYKDSAGKNPLYVLAPYKNPISLVWPGEGFDEVKYGTATAGKKIVTGAVAVFKDRAGLYFCLTPAGSRIKEIGSLGI